MVKAGTRCTAIDRAAHQIVTTGGALAYDALVIATGSLMRELPLLPIGMPRVHYLRTEAHARALKTELGLCKHLVVVGAGLIGLEVAASAAELGIEVRVIEFAPRIMARACDEETGATDPRRASASRRRVRAVDVGGAGNVAAQRHGRAGNQRGRSVRR